MNMNITQLLTSWNCLTLFVVVFADQVGLPVPCPPWILAAGALAADGKLNPVQAVGMTAVATVLADSLWFYLGRKSSARALNFLNRWSPSRHISFTQTRAVVAHHGLWALAAAKFFPGTVMPSLAGALGMSVRQFLLFDGLAAFFYGSCYIAAGFLFHNQIQRVMVWFDRVGHGVIGLGCILVVGYAIYKYVVWRRIRKEGQGQSNDLPQQLASNEKWNVVKFEAKEAGVGEK